MTEPLPEGQKILLQHMMASHVMTDAECDAIIQTFDPEDVEATTLSQCFESINKQLSKGFGLEIASTLIGSEKVHTVINSHADDIAKESFSERLDLHDRAFVRQVLELLSCEGPSSARSTLINLRSELKDPLKMDLERAERNVEYLLEEHYLALCEDETANRRQSMSAKIKLGPRAYLELMNLLTDLGLPKQELPQMFFYR